VNRKLCMYCIFFSFWLRSYFVINKTNTVYRMVFNLLQYDLANAATAGEKVSAGVPEADVSVSFVHDAELPTCRWWRPRSSNGTPLLRPTQYKSTFIYYVVAISFCDAADCSCQLGNIPLYTLC